MAAKSPKNELSGDISCKPIGMRLSTLKKNINYRPAPTLKVPTTLANPDAILWFTVIVIKIVLHLGCDSPLMVWRRQPKIGGLTSTMQSPQHMACMTQQQITSVNVLTVVTAKPYSVPTYTCHSHSQCCQWVSVSVSYDTLESSTALPRAQ